MAKDAIIKLILRTVKRKADGTASVYLATGVAIDPKLDFVQLRDHGRRI